MDAQRALEIADENPSIVKRPILSCADTLLVGFKAEEYAEILKKAA